MRILAASDIHGDTEITKRLAEQAERESVDLVVLCGDLLGFEKTEGLIKPFKDKQKKVLIIPGNWDSFATTDFLAELYGIKNIHGYSVSYEEIGFFGAGGSPSSPERDITTESEVFETLKKAHSGLKGIEKKIMVTHTHPEGSKSEFSGVPGSPAIRKAIKEFKPDLLLHGHIHEASGMEETLDGTKVINVGKQGKIIDI
jgi:uncharacterized protein